MSNKTPIGQLQELCIRKGRGAPCYEEIANGTDPTKTFVNEVSAFGRTGIGQGKSKKEAKHSAAVDLLEQLKLMDEFQSLLNDIPEAPKAQAAFADAVSTLLDKCVQNDWPLAQFTDLQGYGASHAPEFMIECRVASLVRIGKYSTKKGAKQIAAQLMLDALSNVCVTESSDWSVASMDIETAKKKIRTYRELKNSDIKEHNGTLLSDRHKHFQKFDNSQKEIVREILFDIMETPKEKCSLIFDGLGLKYKLERLPESQIYVFELLGNYDCVLSGNDPEIYTDILNYLEVMMNIKNSRTLYVN